MKDNLDRIAPFLPWLGLLFLIAGGIAYVVTSAFDLLTNSLLVAGVVFLLLYIIFRPDDIRRLMGGRQARYGTISILSIFLFAAIGVLLFWIAYQNEDWRLDLTATNDFTPLPETVELLENFDEPIDVIGFYTLTSESRRQTAEQRLIDLKAFKPDLNLEFSDPTADPILANAYDVTADSTLVFIRNRGQEDEVTSQAPTTTDRDLHTALVQLINPRDLNAYFLTGHGEMDTTSFSTDGAGEIADYLADQGFTAHQLNLATAGEVPEDANVLVLLGARAPMQPIEVEILNDYLNNGGAAFIARDVVQEEGQVLAEQDNLRQMLLDEWGIRLLPSYILEFDQRLAGQQNPITFFSINFGTSPIISTDIQDLAILFDIARPLEIQETGGVTYVELASTTENSFGETNLAEPAQLTEDDILGPMPVAVSAENAGTGGRVVVVGDVDFLNNSTSTAAANTIFFSNAINWLAGDEAALELTPRETINRSVALPESQLVLIRSVSCLAGPTLVALLGLYVWFSRKRSR